MSNLPLPRISYATLDQLPTATHNAHWDPGFDAERCMVATKIGPYQRLFEKPRVFKKRFFHTLYPLAIEHWPLNEHIDLYDGFCTVAVEVVIQFQATSHYFQQVFPLDIAINDYIKLTYQELIQDIVRTALLNLTDGAWVKTGLATLEQDIANRINELLLVQEIQTTTTCQLQPSFKDFPDIKFKEESVFLMTLKKNYELITQKQQAQFLHEQALEQQRMAQLQERLALTEQENALELERQALQAAHTQKLLLDQAAQQAELFAIEQRVHAEKLKHETVLHDLTLQETIQREERSKARWNSAKNLWEAEEIRRKQRYKHLEIDADLETKAYHLQQAKLHSDNLSAQNNAS